MEDQKKKKSDRGLRDGNHRKNIYKETKLNETEKWEKQENTLGKEKKMKVRREGKWRKWNRKG